MDASLKKKDNRLGWLDFGKALGMIVVLMVHAGCSLGPVTFYGGMFYMPIFFVAAGYTYRCRPEVSYGSFLKKKAERLLLPYFAASAFLWLFFWVKDSVLAGNPADLKPGSLFGIFYSRNQMYAAGYAGENPVLMDILNAPLWFLTAMFLVYAYYELLSRSRRKYLWLGTGLLASFAWNAAGNGLLLPWSLDGVPYFALFFAAGEGLREHGSMEKLGKQPFQVMGLLALFLVLPRLNGSVNLSCGEYGRSMGLYLFIGTAGSILVFLAGSRLERLYPPTVRLLSRIGQETLLILCFHMFLYMFIRTGAGILGLGEGAVQALLVVGSAGILTVMGQMRRKIKE
ncbi:MAG: acyltransferase family protein [Clostridiales bacterium]|nr:acyltransferase family protein [Clostridiales bacterium]